MVWLDLKQHLKGHVVLEPPAENGTRCIQIAGKHEFMGQVRVSQCWQNTGCRWVNLTHAATKVSTGVALNTPELCAPDCDAAIPAALTLMPVRHQ
jgi:hypothetical protein